LILFSSSFAALCSDGEPVTVSNISIVSSFVSISSESIYKKNLIHIQKIDLIKPFVNQKFASLNGFGLNMDFELTFSFSSKTVV